MAEIRAGIDALALQTSRYVLDLDVLAAARGEEADKFRVGLGQLRMAVPPPDEDVVTLAAAAAKRVLHDIDLSSIEMLIFATESGIDNSKAAGIYVHSLLGLSERCRVVECKQACYAATFALQMAMPFLRANPTKKILLIASDIARYGLNTAGESSQGCAAVAMVLSVNPRLLALENAFGVVTEDVMDFWRPIGRDAALVDGKYSSRLYLALLEKTWQQYAQQSGRSFADHAYFCYHTPVPRLVEKAHSQLVKLTLGRAVDIQAEQLAKVQPALIYGRQIGNGYTASLYMSLASLLDNLDEDLSGKRIGFYSYGSGCVAEFFSGIVQAGYQQYLHRDFHQQQLASRIVLSAAEYENFYTYSLPQQGNLPINITSGFRLAAVRDYKRIYEPVVAAEAVSV